MSILLATILAISTTPAEPQSNLLRRQTIGSSGWQAAAAAAIHRPGPGPQRPRTFGRGTRRDATLGQGHGSGGRHRSPGALGHLS